MYGRGANSVAEQINVTVQEAQELIDKFFNGFPKVREWIDSVHEFAHKNGYVEGLLGRRRRLPDILLPRFSIECEAEDPKFFNPLLGTSEVSKKRNRDITQKYQSLLEKAKTKRDRDVIREEALQENIKIKDNSGFIAQAERQSQNCVDCNTQILTTNGWKYVDDINRGDTIYSLNTESGLIELDTIKNIFKYSGDFDCIHIQHRGFNAIATPEHKWPVHSRSSNKISFVTTEYLSNYKAYGCRKIIRAADNKFAANKEWSDADLYILGIWLTDGSCSRIKNKYGMSDRYSCLLSQKKPRILKKIRANLELSTIKCTERVGDSCSYFYIKQPQATKLGNMFPDRALTYDFISSLSQAQACKLLEGIMDGDGFDNHIVVNSKERVDLLQYLIVQAGKSSSYTEVNNVGRRAYSKNVGNKSGFIETKKIYYVVNVLKRRYAEVLNKNCSLERLDFVWCVETNNHTWIARSGSGHTFITGNSLVQGGAATITKIAMIDVDRDEILNNLGFKMLICVHDEIIGECPRENADAAAKRLSEVMISSAATVCNVPMKCDCYK